MSPWHRSQMALRARGLASMVHLAVVHALVVARLRFLVMVSARTASRNMEA